MGRLIETAEHLIGQEKRFGKIYQRKIFGKLVMKVFSVEAGEDDFTLTDRTDIKIFLYTPSEASQVYYKGTPYLEEIGFLLDLFKRREYKINDNKGKYFLVFNRFFTPTQL